MAEARDLKFCVPTATDRNENYAKVGHLGLRRDDVTYIWSLRLTSHLQNGWRDLKFCMRIYVCRSYPKLCKVLSWGGRPPPYCRNDRMNVRWVCAVSKGSRDCSENSLHSFNGSPNNSLTISSSVLTDWLTDSNWAYRLSDWPTLHTKQQSTLKTAQILHNNQ